MCDAICPRSSHSVSGVNSFLQDKPRDDHNVVSLGEFAIALPALLEQINRVIPTVQTPNRYVIEDTLEVKWRKP